MTSYDIEIAEEQASPPSFQPDWHSVPPHLKGKSEKDAAKIKSTVGAVLIGLIRNPGRRLIARWNWKAALLSSLLRATIFFFTNLVSGWHAALGAMLTELVLRACTSGFYGAITEAFSEARPAWAATAAAMVALPCVAHSLEFLVHWLRGTRKLGLSIGTSVIFTALSTAFNLYAMRRGILTTGRNSKSLRDDLSRIPPLLLSFVLAGPRNIVKRLNPEMMRGSMRDPNKKIPEEI